MTAPTDDGERSWRAWSEAWTAAAGEDAAVAPAPDGAGRSGIAERRAAPGAELAALRRRLAAQRRRLLAVAAGEAVFVLALLALSAVVLAGPAAPWKLAWLASLWGFTVVAAGFSWWNRRATWSAAGASVTDFVQLSRRRCHRQLHTVRFVQLLFLAEVVVVLAQLAWFDRLRWPMVVLLGGLGAAIAGWSRLTRRRLRRELGHLDRFAGELAESGREG